jgi:REP element-mobilizing transposase RayT
LGFSNEIQERSFNERNKIESSINRFWYSDRYEFQFVEIGYDSDEVHFLVQNVPSISVSKLVKLIKSWSARELFKKDPEIKIILCVGNL